jgi:hypothetical protein
VTVETIKALINSDPSELAEATRLVDEDSSEQLAHEMNFWVAEYVLTMFN